MYEYIWCTCICCVCTCGIQEVYISVHMCCACGQLVVWMWRKGVCIGSSWCVHVVYMCCTYGEKEEVKYYILYRHKDHPTKWILEELSLPKWNIIDVFLLSRNGATIPAPPPRTAAPHPGTTWTQGTGAAPAAPTPDCPAPLFRAMAHSTIHKE